MHRTRVVVRGAVVGALMFQAPTMLAQESATKTQAALATALVAKHIALETALANATAKGRPISAKYEVEDGKLQLSVYTEKAGEFFEVIINHHTGKIAKTEKIGEGDDLKNAKAQSAAMAKTKQSLKTTVAKVLGANAGYSAVSAMPTLKDGKPSAEVTLLKGHDFKSVSEPLT